MADSLFFGAGSSLAKSHRSLVSMPAILGWRDFFISSARHWLFLICLAIPFAVFAETIPSTVETTVVSDLEQHPVYVCSGQLLESFSECLSVLNVAHCCSVVYDYLVTETSTNFTVHYYYVYQAGGGNTTLSKEIVEGCPANSAWNGSDCVVMTYSCPSGSGWSLSADQQTCTRPDCPAGYTRDPNTGACLEPCPANQVRNLSTLQCEVQCSSPLIRTEANTCDCPDPLTLIDGNTCIGRDDKELGGDCSPGPSSGLPDWLD